MAHCETGGPQFSASLATCGNRALPLARANAFPGQRCEGASYRAGVISHALKLRAATSDKASAALRHDVNPAISFVEMIGRLCVANRRQQGKAHLLQRADLSFNVDIHSND
jgi:hypothetical protein